MVPEISCKPRLLLRRFELVKRAIFRQIGIGLRTISWQGLNRKKNYNGKIKIGGCSWKSRSRLMWTFWTRIRAQELSPESPDFSLIFLSTTPMLKKQISKLTAHNSGTGWDNRFRISSFDFLKSFSFFG